MPNGTDGYNINDVGIMVARLDERLISHLSQDSKQKEVINIQLKEQSKDIEDIRAGFVFLRGTWKTICVVGVICVTIIGILLRIISVAGVLRI